MKRSDMARQQFRIAATAPAPLDRVWAQVDDSRSWPRWTPIDDVEILSPAPDGGPGEVRLVRNGRYRIRERIVERRPMRRLSYTVESGLAVRDYRATISLAPSADGDATEIVWETTLAAKVPGLGGVYRRALEKATRQFVAGLVAAVRPERAP
jgi:uncharacterized protein YndB with AHSA1/START domain